ncbi:anti-sigma B factor RsbW [Massilibacterium senegalense]|uniref:anti-sigma B factor RsbW n=1 Tax=Massilibacterium senegalense TaxID=1632858 RepID=UPI000783E48E|nr:anti-sigma B factor RsbW [Massilibacterium senegalense]
MNAPLECIEMKIPSKVEYVGVVRLTASGIAHRMGYTYDVIEDIKIAVSEACTNAVHHAYEEAEDGEVKITYGIYPDRLEIMVSDNGKNFDLNKIKEKRGPVRDTPLENMNEGGLGLFLIETLMDEVKISGDSGVNVIMTKFLQKDEVEPYVDRISTSSSK